MKRYWSAAATGLALFLLAGCDSADKSPAGEATGGEAAATADTGPKTPDEVRQEAAKLDRPEPGEYRQTIEVTDVEVPGAPRQLADRMKSMMARTKQSTTCLTAEDADKGFREMFHESGPAKSCTYERFDVGGGTIDARMTCSSPDGGTGTIDLTGTVASTGSDVTMVLDMKNPKSQAGAMKMTMHMTTERLGDCKP
ncbi:Protein of unknown function [Novosphingobium sp. CF614]|uniref:DUF3617 domain-containing protein n=1 Tax=Novosphingobium sp. CF614 TaxID=1884364 RepID=UPI0008ED8F45|nr:DUF3617 domain-containing protein [Novosphingobium sp. CF614]SFF75439.1 Protein of unknown function [Novosphingobium sp. CF614]